MNLYRLLLFGLLAGNVLLRFFTNSINVLPRVFNLWDVALTLVLAALALTVRQAVAVEIDTAKLLRRLLLFNVVCVLGSLLNSEHIYPLAALSQLIMWNEPILVFLAVLQLPFTLVDIRKFQRLLLFLIGLETVIGVLQVPIFLKTGASEAIIGTFAGNAEQYQFFVVIGLFYLLADLEMRQSGRLPRMCAIVGILVLVVLVENKASWVTLALTLAIFLPRLPGLRGKMTGQFKRYAMFGVLLLVGWYVVKMTSATASGKFGNLVAAVESGNLLNLGKVKALRDVVDSYASYPQMALVGSGLGTFYSRAAFQYFPFHIAEVIHNAPVGGYSQSEKDSVGNDSASMAGIISAVSGVKAFYKKFYQYEKIYAVGSGTADFPTSSYISLLGETGIVGFVLYLGFYLMALRTMKEVLERAAHDAVFFPLVASAYATLIYLMFMGFYNFWLDCGRVNSILWCMLALSIRYAALKQQECNSILNSPGDTSDDAVRTPQFADG